MNCRISVVIPTYKRIALLQRCLRAVQDQSYSASEIIIADDGCDSRVMLLVKSSEQRVPLRYVPVPDSKGPAAARNAGVKVATGDLVAFTDDDCVPDGDWLKAAAMEFLKSGIEAAWGRVCVPFAGIPTDYQRNESQLCVAGFVTANCFCKRSVFWQVGGFDENYTAAWREDSDLYLSLLKSGVRMKFLSAAMVNHPIRRASWGISLLQQRKSMFNALLYKRHKQHYTSLIRPAWPWRYYAIVSLFMACAALTILGAATGAQICFMLWAAATLDFAQSRLRDTQYTIAHVAEVLLTSIAIPFLSLFWRAYGAFRFRVAFI
ncbi:MAG: glycosyltransferase [Deltaproteobacteria bacterium]|nr:glycosyltransferase [Deltaproteobacteria bacterium]